MTSPRQRLIAALGFYSIVAQTLLFRDFLAALSGNQFAVGAFFGSWLFWVSVGAWAGKQAAGKSPKICHRFELVTLLYPLAFLFQFFFLFNARRIFGLEPFAVVSPLTIFAGAFFTNAFVSFVTGLLFTLACAWTAEDFRTSPSRVYIFEACGGFVGGLFATILLSAAQSSWTIYFISTVFLLFAAVSVSLKAVSTSPWPRRVFLILCVAALSISKFAGDATDEFQDRNEWSRLLPASAYRGSFATPQSKYLFGEREGQRLLFSGGGVIETYPEPEHASEIAALHLAQNPSAKNILLIGSGGPALASRFLSLAQTEKVVWLHPDPELPGRVFSLWGDVVTGDIGKNFNSQGLDVREYLERTNHVFDTIILNLPETDTLSQSRYTTKEFLSALKRRLSNDGILSVRVSGGANYLGNELALIGASTHAALKSAFAQVVLKPGEESFLIASASDQLTTAVDELTSRFLSIPDAESLYPSAGLSSLFPPDRIAFQMSKYRRIEAGTETDLLDNSEMSPKILFYHLLLGIRRFSSASWSDLPPLLTSFGIRIIPAFLFILFLSEYFYLRKSAVKPLSPQAKEKPLPLYDGMLMFTVGFSGMAMSLVLMFLFQVRYGSLFLYVGLLSSLSMLGSYIGAVLCERRSAFFSNTRWIIIPVTHLLFFGLAIICAHSMTLPVTGVLIFVCGAFTGIYFPFIAEKLRVGGLAQERAGARLEAFDYLGGTVGAVATGLVMLPCYGAVKTMSMLAAAIAAAAILFFAGARKKAMGKNAEDRFYRVANSAGYRLAGIALALLAASSLSEWKRGQNEETIFQSTAASMTGTRTFKEEQAISSGDNITYRSIMNAPEIVGGYLYPSAPLAKDNNGYGGPISLAVEIDADGVLKDFRIVRSKETPAYLSLLRDFMGGLKNRNLFQADPFKGADAVSGATLTSEALMKTLDHSGKKFGSDVLKVRVADATEKKTRSDTWKFIALCSLTAAAIAFRYTRNPWPRRVVLFLSLVVFGNLLNFQYSSQQVFSLLGMHLPAFAMTASFYFVVILPVAVILFGNVYCGYLCPFGALQEFLADLVPKKLGRAPQKEIWRIGRAVKYVLLFVLALLFVFTNDFSVLGADPLVTFFGKALGKIPLLFAMLVLFVSIFFRRFWCRNLCPTGAFLALLNRIRIFRKWMPATRPSACDIGVVRADDSDCILCDRCRHEKN